MKLKHRLMLGPWITTGMLLVATGACVGVFSRYSRSSTEQQHEASGTELALQQARESFGSELAALYRTMAIIDSVKEAQIKEQRSAVAQRTQEQIKRVQAVAAESRDDAVQSAAAALDEGRWPLHQGGRHGAGHGHGRPQHRRGRAADGRCRTQARYRGHRHRVPGDARAPPGRRTAAAQDRTDPDAVVGRAGTADRRRRADAGLAGAAAHPAQHATRCGHRVARRRRRARAGLARAPRRRTRRRAARAIDDGRAPARMVSQVRKAPTRSAWRAPRWPTATPI